MNVCPCIFKIRFQRDEIHTDINNIGSQLDATMAVLLKVSISSTCFGRLFAHLQER